MNELISGVQLSIIGILVVFTALGLLALLMNMFGNILSPKNEKKSPKDPTLKDKEIVAAISASLVKLSKKKIIKPLPSSKVVTNAWKITGRLESINLNLKAVPMAARVAQKLGQEEDPQNHLLMHAMGPNVAGVVGSAVAAGVFIGLVM